MTYLLDTNSLLAFVRYYLPFDGDGILVADLRSKLERREYRIVDRVLDECGRVSSGVILRSLPFLQDKAFRRSADVPMHSDESVVSLPPKFFAMVENNFVIGSQKNRLDATQFEAAKRDYLESADGRMVVVAYAHAYRSEDVCIITEETDVPNDGKLFKKIPAICRQLEIGTMTLPELLRVECPFTVRR